MCLSLSFYKVLVISFYFSYSFIFFQILKLWLDGRYGYEKFRRNSISLGGAINYLILQVVLLTTSVLFDAHAFNCDICIMPFRISDYLPSYTSSRVTWWNGLWGKKDEKKVLRLRLLLFIIFCSRRLSSFVKCCFDIILHVFDWLSNLFDNNANVN